MQDSGRNTPYIVGLTGGIGSGKSTVSALFRELGADVIDADEISRNLVGKNSPLFKVVVDHFGNAVVDGEGNLDRAVLRKVVFSDREERQWLENLLHPEIRKEIDYRIRQCRGDYIVLVVPLLLESGKYDFVDRILVVDVPESIQVSRIRDRDDSPVEIIQSIIAAQFSRQDRLDQADDILYNDASLEEIRERVHELHEQYLAAGAGSDSIPS